MKLPEKELKLLESTLSDKGQSIVVVQAENPDADSLASALALEDILESLEHEVMLYCPVDIPKHLRYLTGWDRVVSDMPRKIDVTIIVDTAQFSLLESIAEDSNYSSLTSSSVFIFDHHESGVNMPFATTNIISDAAATGELIHEVASELSWPISDIAADMIAASIMSDTLGLTTVSTSARTIKVLAACVSSGADLAASNEARRILMRKSAELTTYKGALLQRIEYALEGRIALITIPWEEIEQYSDKYNPTMLVMDDIKLVEGVEIAIGLKLYPDGKITAKLRSNNDYPHCATLAGRFGGGGHAYAAGFKVRDRSLEDVLTEITSGYQEISS